MLSNIRKKTHVNKLSYNFKKIYLLFLLMCMRVCLCVCVCTTVVSGACGGQMRALAPLKPELKASTWVLGTELSSLASVLSRWAASPVPGYRSGCWWSLLFSPDRGLLLWVCESVHTHATLHMWRSKDTFQQLVLSNVASGSQTGILCKCNPHSEPIISYLSSPKEIIFFVHSSGACVGSWWLPLS